MRTGKTPLAPVHDTTTTCAGCGAKCPVWTDGTAYLYCPSCGGKLVAAGKDLQRRMATNKAVRKDKGVGEYSGKKKK